MKYKSVFPAIFVCRLNRFVAKVRFEEKEELVHVKNTGRCRELLVPGAKVYLSLEENGNRKTRFDLIAVEKERAGDEKLLINMDSQAPNQVAAEYLRSSNLFSSSAVICREVFYGNSRFDFYIEDNDRKAFVEVKGVTLESNGIASFPDAPTVRGVKHIKELIKAREEGYEAYVLFVIQMQSIRRLVPNDVTHPQFGEALRDASGKGVKVLAVSCRVSPSSLEADSDVPVFF